MPAGGIIELFPAPSFLSNAASFGLGPRGLITDATETDISAYWAEALIYSVRHTFSPEEQRILSAAKIGIHADHPLRALRDILIANCQGAKSVGAEIPLLLWGASAKHGPTLYAQAGTLLRTPWLESHAASHPEWYGSRDAGDIVMEWALASGVKNEKVLDTLSGLITDHFLNRRPTETFVKLTYDAAVWVRGVAGPKTRLMLAFFRCLQRIAAWQYKGLIRWRSSWLRGTGRSVDAIPGASTYSRDLTALLNQYVFQQRVQGHSAGKKAATFELAFVPQRGAFDVEDFARTVGLELDASGVPTRPAKSRSTF